MFFRIVIPVSRSMLAAIALFIAVINWNDYYNYMMFISCLLYTSTGLPAQAQHSRHEHGGSGVALGCVAVAVGHQTGGGQEGKMLEPSVCSEFLEVNGIPRISVFLQITLEAQIHLSLIHI